MNEEEKKAFNLLKAKSCELPIKLHIDEVKILVNLIEKQEREIQGLNKQADELVDDYEKQLQEKNEYIFRLESERDRWE